jgi:uncharacterized membrane protein YoaK (UPF0700 family)
MHGLDESEGDKVAAGQESALLASQRMRVAYILTLVGGFLDAYTYFVRGGVFANAQTGNIVKLGIALADGADDACLTYLLPICSFALGLLASLVIGHELERRGLRFVRRTVLAIEALGLALVGLMPLGGGWDRAANCVVGFLAAMQYETFTTFRGDAIVTTMSTGNLRKMVDSLFKGVTENDTDQILRSVLFMSIICTFTFGAYLGACVCRAWGRAAVLIPIAALVATIGIITVLRRKRLANASQED